MNEKERLVDPNEEKQAEVDFAETDPNEEKPAETGSSDSNSEKPAVADTPKEDPPEEKSVKEDSSEEDSNAEKPVEVDSPVAEEEQMKEAVVEEMEAEIPRLEEGKILPGRVVLVEDDAVYVDVNWKSDLPVPLNELTREKVASARELVKEGDVIDVMVMETDEDKILLSHRRAKEELIWEKLKNIFHERKVIKGKVSAAVKGGLQVDLEGVSAFLPASHADLGYVSDLKVLVGQELDLFIIEFSAQRRRVVVSRRAVLEEERQKAEKKLFAELKEGDVRTGVITRLASFGAFVDLEQGVEGLLHISEISWDRLNHPSERLKEGEEVKVLVIKVDPEAKRISLSIKQLSPHPWMTVADRYKEGEIVEGEVVRLTSFGAFVHLQEGIDGLIHISQLSDDRVEKAEDVVRVGEKVRVKILKVDAKQKRIGLSLRETQKPKTSAKKEKEEKAGANFLEEDKPLSSNLGAILSEKLAAGNGILKEENEKKEDQEQPVAKKDQDQPAEKEDQEEKDDKEKNTEEK